ncbi:DNA-binding SARP family transcriptional activator [Saccharothrix ecbatanensis]|uniref:DNA-binding SARP family transcriptional activator n=1 Tax=Saccharothrix ecbatanensis TaxID=1105145 RepID=A0A7W9M3Q8_9PSEU|nr:BTAD domain-containing putative transcriptional regulator [Saccharothrix ecbatanensis]MBB5806173.1 DNA-binding SARP family transcriptional activator [Saccharothrix ecbatanensis]
MKTEFKVLGPLEVWHGGRQVPLPTGKARVLLASLLLRAGRVVPMDDLVDRLWDGRSVNPARTRATLHMVVTRLRQSLGAANVVRTATGGYAADVPPGALDLHRFRDLVGRDRFTEALDLWRGAPLSDVPSDVLHGEDVVPLLEERLDALERRLDADLAAGRAAEVVPELRSLTREHPLRERFWGQLMEALSRSDRQAEALAAYRSVAELLAEQLGVDPGPRLQELHQRILTAAPDITVRTPNSPNGSGTPAPRQLPMHTRFFVGREHELNALWALLDTSPAGGTVVISAINGTAGVGKTTLALHWAGQSRNRFPDGQLYVNLRGFDPTGVPMSPDEALRGFLGALGVARDRVPSGLDEKVGLYRSLLAERRVLVVLDNAADSEQVRPLLPSGSRCLALVTSRNQLDGLVVREGARPLPLDVLSDEDATALLERQLGRERVAAEPDAVRELIGHCAGLPLALSVVAARAAAHPDFRLRALAGELADERTRLEALDTGDATASVKTVFSWSYERLSPPAARMFLLLGVHAGREVSIPAAASLSGVPPREARRLMGELSRLHLISEQVPGRFALHDLVHACARDLAVAHEDQSGLRDAMRRVLDHYLHTANNADRLLYSQREEIAFADPAPGVVVPELTERADALAWFQIEHGSLMAAVGHAAAHGFDTHAWQLAWTTTAFARLRSFWHEQARCLEIALAAAKRLDDRVALASTHRGLGRIMIPLRRFAASEANLTAALELARELGDRQSQAHIHRHLAGLYEAADRLHDALHHAEQALEVFEALGDRAGTARALNAVGWARAMLGEDLHRALADCGRALVLFREVNDVLAEAATWDSLGYIHHRMHDLAEAVRCYQAALPRYRESGDRYEEAATLERLGDTYVVAGDHDAARAVWQEALVILDDLGHGTAESVRVKVDGLP